MVTLLQVKDIGRLFEVDGEELRYTVEMAIHGHEQQPHLRAVLKKINVQFIHLLEMLYHLRKSRYAHFVSTPCKDSVSARCVLLWNCAIRNQQLTSGSGWPVSSSHLIVQEFWPIAQMYVSLSKANHVGVTIFEVIRQQLHGGCLFFLSRALSPSLCDSLLTGSLVNNDGLATLPVLGVRMVGWKFPISKNLLFKKKKKKKVD